MSTTAPPAPAPTVRAVAFDMDGLIFDTEALFFRVAGELLAARGKAFTVEMMAAMIGRPAAVTGPAADPRCGVRGVACDDGARARPG